MKLSSRSQYAVQLLLNLALRGTQGAAQLHQVAEAEHISEKYLSQIVIQLRNKGLIHSSRGARGGHALARPAAAITILDIVEAVEGAISMVDDGVRSPEEGRGTRAVVLEMWEDLGRSIATELATLTVQDLVMRYRARTSGTQGGFYQI